METEISISFSLEVNFFSALRRGFDESWLIAVTGLAASVWFIPREFLFTRQSRFGLRSPREKEVEDRRKVKPEKTSLERTWRFRSPTHGNWKARSGSASLTQPPSVSSQKHHSESRPRLISHAHILAHCSHGEFSPRWSSSYHLRLDSLKWPSELRQTMNARAEALSKRHFTVLFFTRRLGRKRECFFGSFCYFKNGDVVRVGGARIEMFLLKVKLVFVRLKHCNRVISLGRWRGQ